MTTYEKNICTAPVFRSRPEINAGFLEGGFWKFSTKPSSIFPFSDENVDDENEDKHTIQDDNVVAGQDVAAGLIRMGILPRIRYLLEVYIVLSRSLIKKKMLKCTFFPFWYYFSLRNFSVMLSMCSFILPQIPVLVKLMQLL